MERRQRKQEGDERPTVQHFGHAFLLQSGCSRRNRGLGTSVWEGGLVKVKQTELQQLTKKIKCCVNVKLTWLENSAFKRKKGSVVGFSDSLQIATNCPEQES